MIIELRSIHALDAGDTGLILASHLDARWVLEDIHAFGQVIDEELAGGIPGALIVTQTIALTNELTAVNVLGRRLNADVLLVEALGGGWQACK